MKHSIMLVKIKDYIFLITRSYLVFRLLIHETMHISHFPPDLAIIFNEQSRLIMYI